MKIVRLFAFVLIALFIVSCARPPQAELNAAKAAVEKASQDPDVERYAAEDLARAREALSRAQTDVQARRYDKAKASALEASAAAAKALADAPAAKARAKDAAAAQIAELKAAIPEAEKLIVSTKKVKTVRLDSAAAAKIIAAAKAALEEAERDYLAGDYIGAQGKAEGAKNSIADLSREISTAVQAATRKK
ncbi:MAG: DUF4398 domain-containing protein [Spirochaetaceae bacterium]|nr:DUF4398 domain-containing protein [Spirochaetaceae bacterium]